MAVREMRVEPHCLDKLNCITFERVFLIRPFQLQQQILNQVESIII
jgi:hypothetical protein